MIGSLEKEYWLMMVVVEYLFAEGLRIGNLLGINMGRFVFGMNFVKENKM